MRKTATCGRPKGDFVDSSKRTKRRRIAEQSKGDRSTASALRSFSIPTKHMCTKAVVNEVLALLIEAKMSKHQYVLIQSFIYSKLLYNFLPSYKLLLKAKASSIHPYPGKISVSESQAEVELQSLLHHTALRVVRLQHDVLAVMQMISLKSSNWKMAI